jgi:diguanylate cyclase (GGDEF)-like protein/PAS domain S-box-containing protein
VSEFENPEIYRTVLEELPAGVYLVDRHRRIVFWNCGAERICGYLRQDVVGRFLRDHLFAINDDSGASDYDPLDQVLRDGRCSTAHVSILHKEGYRIPIVLQTAPIRNEHGSIIGAVECFDSNIASSEQTRRRSALAGLIGLDDVTGLPSKNSMANYLQERLSLFAERHADFGIFLVELDDLEHLRKGRGPSVVTSLLRVLAHTLQNSLRPSDGLGAWSDEQFMGVLNGCREADLELVANRVRKMIGQSEVEWWGDRITVTAALGTAACRAGDTFESLLDRAEKSLAESRAAGGHRTCIVK